MFVEWTRRSYYREDLRLFRMSYIFIHSYLSPFTFMKHFFFCTNGARATDLNVLKDGTAFTDPLENLKRFLFRIFPLSNVTL